MSEVGIDSVRYSVAPCATGCRRHAAGGVLLAAAGWLAAAVSALAVAAVPFDFGESLCGVWGCFPPVPALAAMHLFWCVALAAGVHAVRTLRPNLLRPLSATLLLAAAVGIALIVGGDLRAWLAGASDSARAFWPRRVGYTFATKTDYPLLQVLAAGVVCLVLHARTRRGAGSITFG